MESDVVKTGLRAQGRDKSRGWSECCRGGNRCTGGMTVIQALVRNMGTCRCDVKGDSQVAEIIRLRVPMHSTGADRSVVVMKLL